MAAERIRTGRQEGFTLLELLVSIAIFAVVISSVYGAYRATFHTISGTDQLVARAAAVRVILERITEDLEALYTGEDGLFAGEKSESATGRADSLKFYSSANLVFTRDQVPAGRTMIEYTTRESEGGGFDLVRVDTPQLPGSYNDNDDDGEGEILGRGLSIFSLSYFSEGGDRIEDWQSEGVVTDESSPGRQQELELPVLVQVVVGFPADGENSSPSLFRTSIALPRIYRAGEQEGGS